MKSGLEVSLIHFLLSPVFFYTYYVYNFRFSNLQYETQIQHLTYCYTFKRNKQKKCWAPNVLLSDSLSHGYNKCWLCPLLLFSNQPEKEMILFSARKKVYLLQKRRKCDSIKKLRYAQGGNPFWIFLFVHPDHVKQTQPTSIQNDIQ